MTTTIEATAMKCEICRKREATVIAHKLWGKGGSLKCCDECKPDASKRPAAVRHLPDFYRVEPIEK